MNLKRTIGLLLVIAAYPRCRNRLSSGGRGGDWTIRPLTLRGRWRFLDDPVPGHFTP